MHPPPIGLIPLIFVAFPSERIHSRTGSSLIAATVESKGVNKHDMGNECLLMNADST